MNMNRKTETVRRPAARGLPLAILLALAGLAAAALLVTCCSGTSRPTLPAEPVAFAPAVEPNPARWQAARGTALLVVDLQRAYMPAARQAQILATVQSLVAAADAAGAPVIWVYNQEGSVRPGSPAFELVEPLAPAAHHYKVVKQTASAFAGTDLEAILTEAGVGRLVICGLASTICVRATVDSAVSLDYHTVVVADAHTVPSSVGGAADIADMNERWRADERIELLPANAVSFDARPLAALGLGAADWSVSPDFAGRLDADFQAWLRLLPENATDLGLTGWVEQDDTLMNGLSPQAVAALQAQERLMLQHLQAEDRSGLSAGDLLSLLACQRALEDTVALQRFTEYDYLVNPTVFGISYSVYGLFSNSQPLATPVQAEAYVTRLSALAGKLAEAAAAMERRTRSRLIAPRIVLQSALPDLEALANASATDFYQILSDKLAAMAGLAAADREDLLTRAGDIIASAVIPAAQRLSAAVSAQLERAKDEVGAWTLPDGADYYQALLRAKTTTDLTPQQIHDRGLAALETIHAEILRVGLAGGLAGSTPMAMVGQAFSAANNVGPDEALRLYTEGLAAVQGLVRPYFPDFPTAPVEVRTAPQGGYYAPAPLDGSRPGVFFVAAGAGANRAGIPTLLHHETIPGHHLQMATNNQLVLPTARKLLYFEAYTEGWALYAERLMAELGAYDGDPVGNIGRLQAEAFRAARLVVDTGLHTMQWTMDQAVDFMMVQAFMPRRAAENEVVRYISLPAQSTSYYIGFLKFLELRDKARAALGDGFSLAAFHRTVLSCGPVPFDVLEAVVDRYIAQALAGR
ncbi:MAG: hypothetical protein A2087_10065 [Spirochaetes bacterium GWD1_61_31]|nr:MAG: hypothetical protein A2Y37_01885 [Spirochaetes bacterium GWB1_60_80]OHD40624.1 MAG: hypothetical protein A2087_10065 [Spirochaetes bacterium GWD1_61_31]OHD43896.1 MAG: hypothetical protein A2Y35_12415 [Spirochaetes bacterium GWE1_60_18]OHD59767.1 MAG: hypothetical protein A2Y32_02270 [Spirochaetes bacterium GWF1_60_12]